VFVAERGWNRSLDEPIVLGRGRTIETLRQAADLITALPAKESAAPEWQAAIEAIMLVAELGGRTMFARICMLRALNGNVERVFTPSRKDPYWGKRKLKRDE
jgi:hypothetical protein